MVLGKVGSWREAEFGLRRAAIKHFEAKIMVLVGVERGLSEPPRTTLTPPQHIYAGTQETGWVRRGGAELWGLNINRCCCLTQLWTSVLLYSPAILNCERRTGRRGRGGGRGREREEGRGEGIGREGIKSLRYIDYVRF